MQVKRASSLRKKSSARHSFSLKRRHAESGKPVKSSSKIHHSITIPPPSSGKNSRYSPLAQYVLEARYLRKDENGNLIETPEQMFRRVARYVASAEQRYNPHANALEWEQNFFEVMDKHYFLPNSPTLMNAGTSLGQLSACFVLPISDSVESIFETLKNAMLIHQSGGGTGFSFSRLRPKGSKISKTGGKSSGPVSFISIFDKATEVIKQGGRRRGANMAVLSVRHPDILEFINVKCDDKGLKNFNLSVSMDDSFMKSVSEGTEYSLIDPLTGTKSRSMDARKVFDALTRAAWKCGDPGVIFIDLINRDNPTPALGNFETTNPCGEVPLLPFEACTLGSINLSKMVKYSSLKSADIDWELLRTVIMTAVRFLDDVIDVNHYPLQEIEDMVKANRKIGIGVMGFAEFLVQIGVPYDSEAALNMAENIMSFISAEARQESMHLAKVRGSFPNFSKSKRAETHECMRNATLTSIAPTGTLSIIAGTTPSIEPIFSLIGRRHAIDREFVEINQCLVRTLNRNCILNHDILEEISKKGSIRTVSGIPGSLSKLFPVANEIPPEWHVRMQSMFQKHTSNAVSKTVNLNNDASVADVRKIYSLAYELGCKGITIFREGSMSSQVFRKANSAASGFRESLAGEAQRCVDGECRV